VVNWASGEELMMMLWGWSGWLSLLLFLAASGTAQAARLLKMTISVDGKQAALAHYEDRGTEPVGIVWRYLHRDGFELALNDRNEERPGRNRELRGEIEIRIEHAGRALALAKVDHLTVVRGRDDKKWILAEEELARTARAAGIVLGESEEERQKGMWAALGIGGGVLLFWVVFRMMSKRPSVGESAH
jgi:hypothetical protein